MINVTQAAADKIRESAASADCVGIPLRIAIAGGGCSGQEYRLGFDNKGANDAEFSSNGIAVIVDPNSLPMLKGLELDYVDDAEGSSFVFKNPNPLPSAGGGCGCGGHSHC